MKWLTRSLCLLVLVLTTWLSLYLHHSFLLAHLETPDFSTTGTAQQQQDQREITIITSQQIPHPSVMDGSLPLQIKGPPTPTTLESHPTSPIPSPQGPRPGGSSTGPRGYVMPLEFSEQMESGMYDLQQLADLAHSWRLQLLEPYVHNSHFSFPDSPRRLLRLGEVYDLGDLNRNLRASLNAHYDPIIPLQEVVREVNTSANVQVVMFRLIPYTLSAETCSKSSKGYVDTFSFYFKYWKHLQVACINIRKKVNFRALINHTAVLGALSRSPNSKIIILIPNWHGIRTYDSGFFYWDLDFKPTVYKHTHATKHSLRVQSAATDFTRSLHLATPTLGIHVRLERLLKVKPFRESNVRKCLDEALITVRSLSSKINGSVLFRDYGKYGSSTCKRASCADYAKQFNLDQRFRDLGVKVQEYIPTSKTLRPEHGYSANVEQEVLSRTDYLVTVGYGSFQRGIVERWLRYREEEEAEAEGGGEEGKFQQDRIFRLCTND